MDAGREYFVDARRIHERYESETSAHHMHRQIRPVSYHGSKQQEEALLLQRNCATRLSVEISQLRNIPF